MREPYKGVTFWLVYADLLKRAIAFLTVLGINSDRATRTEPTFWSAE